MKIKILLLQILFFLFIMIECFDCVEKKLAKIYHEGEKKNLNYISELGLEFDHYRTRRVVDAYITGKKKKNKERVLFFKFVFYNFFFFSDEQFDMIASHAIKIDWVDTSIDMKNFQMGSIFRNKRVNNLSPSGDVIYNLYYSNQVKKKLFKKKKRNFKKKNF